MYHMQKRALHRLINSDDLKEEIMLKAALSWSGLHSIYFELRADGKVAFLDDDEKEDKGSITLRVPDFSHKEDYYDLSDKELDDLYYSGLPEDIAEMYEDFFEIIKEKEEGER